MTACSIGLAVVEVFVVDDFGLGGVFFTGEGGEQATAGAPDDLMAHIPLEVFTIERATDEFSVFCFRGQMFRLLVRLCGA